MSKPKPAAAALRRLVVVLGDQLDLASAALDDFDTARDAVWMCEAEAEATYVWSHPQRIALFLSAMRHHAQALREAGRTVHYRALGTHAHASLAAALEADIAELKPQSLVIMEPGEWRLQQDFHALVERLGIDCHWRDDRHYLCSRTDFAEWMQGRKQPRMEHFYRRIRQRSGWLMDGDEPVGGQWNYDSDNRQSFDARGPGFVPATRRFEPDATTREVLQLVAQRFPDHPGTLDGFDWPVTRAQALQALDDFIQHRLADFGPYQDAMWAGEPLLWHSRLSAALNLHLLDPREVCEAAIAAYRSKRAPLASVEGFVRQILGWREYVRGLYWHRMPQHLDDNALDAQQPLPAFFWTADTDYNCLRETIGDTLQNAYAHHIQRLMVTGLFTLLLGVRPREVHQWYLAVYTDAVEWVELPNTIGMSQHADGGILGSKPYIATGKYIERMSNYCVGCRYRPDVATGEHACPYTTLYWDFLDRHAKRFGNHPRLKLQIANLHRKPEAERAAIAAQAAALRQRLATSPDASATGTARSRR